MVRAVLTGRSTVFGFNLAWFSSLIFRAPLCLWSSWCYIYIFKNLKKILLTSFSLPLVSWAWWDWPLTWLTNHRPSVLWHCWLGHLTPKIVSEMTHNVSSGTLNPTIPSRESCYLLVCYSTITVKLASVMYKLGLLRFLKPKPCFFPKPTATKTQFFGASWTAF